MKKINYLTPQTMFVSMATNQPVLHYISEGGEGDGGGEAPLRNFTGEVKGLTIRYMI